MFLNVRMPRPGVVLGTVLVFAISSGAPALSQAAPAMKIAVVDTQKIVFESAMGKKTLEEIRLFQEQKQAEAATMKKDLDELQGRITDGRLSLSEDKLSEMQSELETDAKNLRRFTEDAAAELEKRRNQVLVDMDRKVMPVINAVGNSQGYTMIFRKFESGLVFVNDAVDITTQVIQKLDSELAGAQG